MVTAFASVSSFLFLISGLAFAYAAPRTDRRYVAYMPIPCFLAAGLQLGYALHSSGVIQ